MASELTIVEKPKAPTSAKHRTALSQHRLDGQPLTISDNQPLIPLTDCRSIIAEMDAAISGSDADSASILSREIIGAYPNARPDNPEAYGRSIILAISACPRDLYQELYRVITQRPVPFPPQAGEISSEISGLISKRRAAKAVAEAHIREHERRAASPKPKCWADMTPEEKTEHEKRMEKLREILSAPQRMEIA